MSLIRHEHRPGWPVELTWPDERFDRVFRDMFRDFFAGGALLDRFVEGMPTHLHLEEYAEDGTYVIRAELPGIDPDKDIEIQVVDGMMHLQARREERTEEDRPSGYHSEFRYGSFARSIRLPDGATEDDVKASCKDGILEVRVLVGPAPGKAPVKVPIQHG